MQTLTADKVADAFNDRTPEHWRARPYLKGRNNGVFNAVSFTYRRGLIRLLMDCDAPLGRGFQVKFEKHMASFGDYTNAIQKALYMVLASLRDAGLAPEVAADLEPRQIGFSIHKDGTVIYVGVGLDGTPFGYGAGHVFGDGTEKIAVDDIL